ncbi:MAG TPA: hypothetical protein PLB62_10165, partial [Candidatus Sumerlaeota bacterium]|nr:hypothetical protein [Candidatus Sumerlaeota bacterium]
VYLLSEKTAWTSARIAGYIINQSMKLITPASRFPSSAKYTLYPVNPVNPVENILFFLRLNVSFDTCFKSIL